VSAAGKLEAGRLQQELDAARRELKTRLAETETLRGEMTRIPLLEMQLEQGKKEARRQFERAPYPICRCMRDGRIIQVNHSFARLLGYRKADDLRDKDLATLFECGNDLRWLIECSTKAETADAVETTWKTTDQRRLHVRLFAHVATGGSIEIAVENITGLREVEDRLRQAHRMEAVGRLASEVAVNCESLLRDGEVTRAAGLLRQFSVYGDKQISALEPVSVQRVLRNLGPVLKRLAGDNVRFVLPKTSASFDVDVDAERVERILVNVASYARDRMPHGGRVKIDLATTVVDRRFLARYPNVRPGAHVLLTVTEVRGAMRSVLTIAARPHPKPETMPPTRAGSGVDLGGLLGLIADCEGHLWMAAEPSGNMTLKIYLPCRESGAASEAAPAARAGRGSQLARWFRH
jgi:PAS domain S-box-containing protein